MADRLSRRRIAGDEGFTLPDLIVAIGIFLVLLTILVSGAVSIARASTQARLDAQTSSAVGIALQRIERSVRYADALNYPGVVSGAAYVEWRTDKDATPAGVTTCSQLRYRAADGTLALRTWPSTAPASTGTWSVLLTNIRGAATATSPFTTIAAAGGVSNFQGLTIALATGLSDEAGTNTSTTVYAKNSSVESISNPVGSGGQSATPVCAVGGVVDRP